MTGALIVILFNTSGPPLEVRRALYVELAEEAITAISEAP